MQFDRLKRRDFVVLLGGMACGWPLAAQAQQPAPPVVGWLTTGSPESDAARLAGLRQGLTETGYVEGRHVTIDYRWTGGKYDQLPALAADLVRRRVATIIAVGTPSALAAKAARATIPIVFSVGGNPIRIGLVSSFNRPGGNLTGVANLLAEVAAKRLELLRESVPGGAAIALLVNPTNPYSEEEAEVAGNAARSLGLQLHVLRASTASEIDAAFGRLADLRGAALMVGLDPFLADRSSQIAFLATRFAVAAIAGRREFAAAGGLMSYAPDFRDIYRRVGIQVGKILSGVKPADLPVEQAVKVELVINVRTAKALGFNVPLKLLAFADEVIE